jgi:hypothetical protein
MKNMGVELTPNPKHTAAGRFVKRHPYDCGSTKCGICHPHKQNKACKSKFKDEHGILEEVVKAEVYDDFGED